MSERQDDDAAVPDDQVSPQVGQQVEQAVSQAADGPMRLRMRRAPKYRAFGLTGVVLGVVIGLVLAFSRAASGDYSQQTIAGYFAASFGLIGALLGLGVAVLADRRR